MTCTTMQITTLSTDRANPMCSQATDYLLVLPIASLAP